MVFSYLKLLRPHQWIKNLLLLFPPFFAGKIADPEVLTQILPALAAFSCASSCGYIINDIRDLEADKNHKTKRSREIASARISLPSAILISAVLFVISIVLSWSIDEENRRFPWFVALYLLNSLGYTFYFKNYVILDIFLIAFGFLLRVLAGGEAFSIPVTSWLFLTVFSVSLLLATGKRLGELISLGDEAKKHRIIFGHYSQSFLEGLLWFSASSAIVMYALYTLEHKNVLYYSVPLAAFGLLRYIFIVKEGKGDPTDALLYDRQILGVGIAWFLMIGIIVYKWI
jgi:decaprenyl-phosphate phosphoribosyltransferase